MSDEVLANLIKIYKEELFDAKVVALQPGMENDYFRTLGKISTLTRVINDLQALQS